MPTPCQKCFTIALLPAPCVVDCDGAPTTIAALSWVITETDYPGNPAYGDATLSAAGASGSFSITGAVTNLEGGEGNASGYFSTRICNNTNTDFTILFTFTFDWSISITASLGVGGQCGIALLRDAFPFPEIFFQQTVELTPAESGTETESNTGESLGYEVFCAACSVTEFALGVQGGGNAGGPISDPASLSYSLVGTFLATLA